MRTTVTLIAIAVLAVPLLAGGDEPVNTPFVQNKGQWTAPFLYQAGSRNLAVFLEQGALTWSMLQPDFGEVLHEAMHTGTAPMLSGHAWRVHFEGAQMAEVEANDRSAQSTNYILGNDPARWKSGVPAFGEVRYNALWPGISMRLYRQEGNFKYDLLMDPSADETSIALRYEGLNDLQLDANGDLVLSTSLGVLREMAPVAWYADNPNEKVACTYVLQGNTLSYQFTGADRSRRIVIDPVLIASTLSGTGDIGLTQNYGHTATYDALGNMYTGARSFGQGYPTSLGAFQSLYGGGSTDMAFTKFNGDGSALIWSTYVGGSNTDFPHSMFADDAGTLYAMGTTWSPDFPVTSTAFDMGFNGGVGDVDIAVLRLQDDGGSLIGSTFMGGTQADGTNTISENYGDTYRGEIIIDDNGNCYVSGCSSSPDFPTTAGVLQTTHGGAQDGVVFSLNHDMSVLNWSTFIGGAGEEMAYGLRRDANGDLYVCGSSGSSTLATTPGAYQGTYQGGDLDGFVMHVAAGAGSVIAGTYFGTTELDQLMFIDLDGAGNVYVYGQTMGTIAIQPVGTYGIAGEDLCLAKLDPDLTTALFTSTIGNNSFGYSAAPVAFMVDVCGHPCISGYNTQTGLPTTADSLMGAGSAEHFYLGVFDVDMSGLLFGTYFSGHHVDAGTSHFDPNGIIYQAVCTAGPFSTTSNAWSSTQTAGWDVGVFKIDLQQAGVQAYVINPPEYVCNEQPTAFNGSGNAVDWQWDFGDGSGVVPGQNVSHTYTQTGTYTVKLSGQDPATCNVSDTMQWSLVVDICSGVVDHQQDEKPFTAWYNGAGGIVLAFAEVMEPSVRIEILAMNGTVVRQRQPTVSGGQAVIPVGDLASGLYAVRVTGEHPGTVRVLVHLMMR